MADPFHIHDLNPTALPNRLHEVWAERNNIDVKLRLEQILGLLQSGDLAGKIAASATSFDPSGTGLTATEVQTALEEIASGYLRKAANGSDIPDPNAFMTNIGVPLRGHLWGLGTANATDADHDILVSKGECASDDGTAIIRFTDASIVKQADAEWTAGNNAGGMVAGESLPTNGTVHLHAIMDADGVVDFCINNHASSGLSPTLPTGFTHKRRIASFCTDASANIYPFLHTEDLFTFKTPKADISGSGASQASTPISRTITVPSGLKVKALLSVLLGSATAGSGYAIVSDPDLGSITASLANQDIYNPANLSVSASLRKMTNTSRQVATSYDGVDGRIWINTKGYIDTRGRLG